MFLSLALPAPCTAVGFCIGFQVLQRKFLWWWLCKTLINRYSRISIGLILLLWYLTRILFGFSIGPWTNNSQGFFFFFVYLSCVWHGFQLIQWALNTTREYFVGLKTFVPLLHKHVSCRQITDVNHRVCKWAGGYFSPLVVCRVYFSTLNAS